MKPAPQKINVGVVGCGVISGIYFENLLKFGAVDVVACSDLIPELSEAVADANPGIQAMTTDELLARETWRPLAWKAQARSVRAGAVPLRSRAHGHRGQLPG